jgi:hypothetical protein
MAATASRTEFLKPARSPSAGAATTIGLFLMRML